MLRSTARGNRRQSRRSEWVKSVLRSVIYCLSHEWHADVFESLRMPAFSVLFKQPVVLKYIWSHEHCTLYTPQRDLRFRVYLVLPRVHTKYGERLHTFYVPSVLNSLPSKLFSVSSHSQIRASILNYVVDLFASNVCFSIIFCTFSFFLSVFFFHSHRFAIIFFLFWVLPCPMMCG